MTSNSILKHRRKFGAAGFTLIEVMIAIVLLVMISVAIYQATTQTFRYRAKIINEGDFYAGIRLAMGLIDRDVAALFSPVTLNPNGAGGASAGVDADAETNVDRNRLGAGGPGGNPGGAPPSAEAAAQAQQLEELKRSELGQVTDYWLGATDMTAIRPSRFVGTADRLQFVTASHQRVYKNYRESEYAKVVYEIREDPNPDKFENTKILVKIENPNVFDELEKKDNKETKVYPLLPGIRQFRIRYFRRNRQEKKGVWETAWDTSKDNTIGAYPDLVEVTIEVASFNRLAFKGTYLFKPETPFYGLDATL